MEANGNVKKVVDYIYNQILTGERELGSPISENQVAEILGISRSPVREGLKLMEGEGLIVHYNNRGTFVSDITRDDIEEIFELRITFELMALNNACSFMDHAVIAELKKNIMALNENSKPREYYSANTALHNAIVQYGGNKRLAKFYDTLSMQIALINRISGKLPSHFRESRKKHLNIVLAIEERNLDLARQLLKEHLEDVRANTLKIYSL